MESARGLGTLHVGAMAMVCLLGCSTSPDSCRLTLWSSEHKVAYTFGPEAKSLDELTGFPLRESTPKQVMEKLGKVPPKKIPAAGKVPEKIILTYIVRKSEYSATTIGFLYGSRATEETFSVVRFIFEDEGLIDVTVD
jgi:hypothetical protein